MTMERDSLVARLGKLHEYDLVLDTNAYPKGPMAEGRDVYRVIGWEGADRGGLLLSEVEAREVRAAFRESSAAAALSRPEQVATDEIDAILQDSFGFASGADFIRKVSERIAALTTTAAPLQADASAPASPAIGIQAVKALADRVRALLLVDQPASWEERRKIADELESLSALHPAPEAASAGAAGHRWVCRLCGGWSYARVDERKPDGSFGPGPDVRCEDCKDVSALPSDTAPSPKGVSDGVRAAARRAVDAFRTYAIALRGPFATRYDTANDLDTQAKLLEAALSQEPVPATAEERAASKEGA